MSARLDASESPVVTTAQAREAADRLGVLVAGLSEIILGKEDVLRLAVTCLLARGHLLFEDLPGVGKTLLSQALAQALGLRFRRVQFTSDLLPADILGANMYDRQSGGFVFHPGPVFAQVLLADEINRATPKTQSALLEAMEEGRVTCDGESHALPAPFFVIATQNPSTQMGTFMLPESQLDRFLMRLALGVPDRAAERSILQGRDRREALREMPELLSWEAMSAMQQQARHVHVSPALLDYLQDLLAATRAEGRGLSPRGGLA
ncbi:MAG TPA: AAA family ATPase, partial [Prosthecobacter sp.]|nr:AAA family ATPase [Prosthecobacter sp.]